MTLGFRVWALSGLGFRGPLGDIDPLNSSPFKGAGLRRVPLEGSP